MANRNAPIEVSVRRTDIIDCIVGLNILDIML
jgi:hypothetical protein